MTMPPKTILLVLLLSVVSTAAYGQSSEKPTPPDASQQKMQLREVGKVFDLEKRRSVVERAELAKQLGKIAEETSDNPPQRFVLFDLARQNAADSGAIVDALTIVDRLETEYAFEGSSMRADSLERAAEATGIPLPAKRPLLAIGESIVQRSVQHENFAAALSAADQLQQLARRLRDREATTKWAAERRELQRLKAASVHLAAAREKLRRAPNDGRALREVGLFLAFGSGDFTKAWDHLARCDLTSLSNAAKREQQGASNADAQFQLGEFWWEAAEQLSDSPYRDPMLARAAAWYEAAAPDLAILSRAKAVRRVGDIAKLGIEPAEFTGNQGSNVSNFPHVYEGVRHLAWAPPGQTLNLLPLVEPARDQVDGEWRWDDGKLVSPVGAHKRLRLPVIPPENYRLRVLVEPLVGGDLKNLVLTLTGRNGARFAVQMEGYRGFDNSGLDRIDGRSSYKNATRVRGEVLKRGEINEVIADVRTDSVVASVNGDPLFEYRDSLDRLSVDSSWDEPGRLALLLGAYRSPFKFHAVELTPLPSTPGPYPPMGNGPHAWRRPSNDPPPTATARLRQVFLDDLPEFAFRTGWGIVGKRGFCGHHVSRGSQPQVLHLDIGTPVHSIALHPSDNASAWAAYRIDGRYQKFTARVGVGRDTTRANRDLDGQVIFRVYGDGKLLAETEGTRKRGPTEALEADVRGVNCLTLMVHCQGRSGSAWAAFANPLLEK